MVELTAEERFIFDKLKENGGTINYKELQQLCEDEFEGLRLILKKMKEKGIVHYEGIMAALNSDITLIKDVDQPKVK
ncbi:MAG: hypothetical protein ACP6IY_05070 [Promethearchaeia archaeon]